jgi:hypothetical protein
VLAALRHRVVIHRAAGTTPTLASVAATAPIPPAATPAAPVMSSVPSAASGSNSAPAGTSSGSSGSGGSTTASTPSNSTSGTAQTPAKPTYKVKHVFVIALSTTSYQATWGHGSVATYLNAKLRPKGTLLSGYRTLGTAELADYLAMISGQAPNPDSGANCPNYAEFGSTAKPNRFGQVSGRGCIYPSTVLTIGDQVTATGKTWKAYMDGMGSATCVHPNSNVADNTQLTGAGTQYATRHNPFIYFHSLLDLGDCSNDDVSLDRLPAALRAVSGAPTYSFIAPGLCADASQLTCPDGQRGGLAAEDAFLELWVPRILSSPAYKQDGALIIVFAATPPPAPAATSTSTSTSTTTTSATSTTTGTTTTAASTTTSASTTSTTTPSPSATPSPSITPPSSASTGPVRTGALIVSRYTKRGGSVPATYDPYSVLRSLEDLFGYTPLVNASKARSFLKSALPGA